MRAFHFRLHQQFELHVLDNPNKISAPVLCEGLTFCGDVIKLLKNKLKREKEILVKVFIWLHTLNKPGFCENGSAAIIEESLEKAVERVRQAETEKGYPPIADVLEKISPEQFEVHSDTRPHVLFVIF